jgi:hypothetical protein
MPELLLRLMPIEPVVEDVRAGLDPLVLPESDFLPLSEAGEEVTAASSAMMQLIKWGAGAGKPRGVRGDNKRLSAVHLKCPALRLLLHKLV